MKKHVFLSAVLTVVVMTASAQSTKWAFDLAHSSVRFDVSHMVISEVTGQFKKFDGTVLSDKKDFSDAKIDFSIDVSSINTDNEKRDAHLKSAEFFDAEKYPEITFKGKSLKLVSGNAYKLTGDLTMHGVTKTVTFDMKYGGTVQDPYKNTKAGFKITGTVNRKDFGLVWNMVLESGGLMVGEEVTITCNVELKKM